MLSSKPQPGCAPFPRAIRTLLHEPKSPPPPPPPPARAGWCTASRSSTPMARSPAWSANWTSSGALCPAAPPAGSSGARGEGGHRATMRLLHSRQRRRVSAVSAPGALWLPCRFLVQHESEIGPLAGATVEQLGLLELPGKRPLLTLQPHTPTIIAFGEPHPNGCVLSWADQRACGSCLGCSPARRGRAMDAPKPPAFTDTGAPLTDPCAPAFPRACRAHERLGRHWRGRGERGGRVGGQPQRVGCQASSSACWAARPHLAGPCRQIPCRHTQLWGAAPAIQNGGCSAAPVGRPWATSAPT
jgi:hypothetical protein